MQPNIFRQLGLFDDAIEEAVALALPVAEGLEIEYKSAKGGFPDSFWDTYSAFANTNGGIIALGVKQKDSNFTADGLTENQINHYRQVFFDLQNDRQKISRDLLQDGDVLILSVPDKPGAYLLAFSIPRATATQRPIYKGRDPYSGSYKRRNEGDYKCSPEEVRRMLADSDPAHPADSRILRGFSIDNDLDVRSLRQYKRLMSVRDPSHPWLVLDDTSLLTQLGGYRKDRNTGEEGLTIAGLLMFGKTLAIQDPAALPEYRPDYQEILSADPDIRWTDRITSDGTWEANLFQFFQAVWPRLAAGLPKPFRLEGGIRQDQTKAHEALREAFVNALVHADYSAPGSLVVRRLLNGYTFINPGTLLISVDQYYAGGASIPRNKALQRMFFLMGAGEQAGSGAAKIAQGWKSLQWQRPYIEERDSPDRVVLHLSTESILIEAKEKLQAHFGDAADGLYGDELTALSIAVLEEQVTNERLQLAVYLHKSDITQLLRRLCEAGFLTASGKGRGTVYKIPDIHGSGSAESSDTSPEAGALTNNATYAPNNTTPAVNDTTSGANDTTSGANDTTSGLDSTTSSEKRGKVTRAQLKAMILTAASHDYLTVKQLSSVVGRSASYIKAHFIQELIAEGLLVRKYEDAPNHPAQAYKANALAG